MGCGPYWKQVHTIEKALSDMDQGILPYSAEYHGILEGKRGALMATIGYKFPREGLDLMPTTFLSPESFKAILDSEIGYVVMARRSPKALPVYHTVSAEEAGAVMRSEISPELKERLLTPDVDIDN